MKVTNAAASLALALLLSLTALGIAAAVEAPPTLMSRADYVEGLRTIQRGTRHALGGCRDLAAPQERAVCRAQARAAQRMQEAELDARYRGTIAAHQDVERTRVRAEFGMSIARRLASA